MYFCKKMDTERRGCGTQKGGVCCIGDKSGCDGTMVSNRRIGEEEREAHLSVMSFLFYITYAFNSRANILMRGRVTKEWINKESSA